MFIVCVLFSTGSKEVPDFENLTFGTGRPTVKPNLGGPKKPKSLRLALKLTLRRWHSFVAHKDGKNFASDLHIRMFRRGVIDLGRLLTKMLRSFGYKLDKDGGCNWGRVVYVLINMQYLKIHIIYRILCNQYISRRRGSVYKFSFQDCNSPLCIQVSQKTQIDQQIPAWDSNPTRCLGYSSNCCDS